MTRISDSQILTLSNCQIVRSFQILGLSENLADSQAARFSDSHALSPSDFQIPCCSESQVAIFSDSQILTLSDTLIPIRYEHAHVHYQIGFSDSQALRLRFSESQTVRVSQAFRLRQNLPGSQDSQIPNCQTLSSSDSEIL